MDDLLCEIIAEAMLRSPCGTGSCRLSADAHPWYFEIRHLDAGPHACPVCRGAELPRYTVSIATLLGPRRDALTAALNAWMRHLHLHVSAPARSTGGDGRPIDADALPDAPLSTRATARSGADAAAGSRDRVGRGPRD